MVSQLTSWLVRFVNCCRLDRPPVYDLVSSAGWAFGWWLAGWLLVEVWNETKRFCNWEPHGDYSHLTTVNLNQVHTFRAPAQVAVGLGVIVIVRGR